MLRSTKVVAMAAVLLVAACANQRLNYVTAEKSFKAGVDFCVHQRKAGEMTDATYLRLNPAIQMGNEGLKMWLKTILETPEGQQPDVAQTVFNMVMKAIDILEAYTLQETRDAD